MSDSGLSATEGGEISQRAPPDPSPTNALSRVIRDVRPEVVLCQSPERRWDRVFASHPDHLAAGEATMQAVYPDARNPHAHPELAAEGLQAWTVLEVWVFAHPRADRFVDITDTFAAKVDALRAHASQTSAMDLDPFLRSWARSTATDAGLGEDRLAEAFLSCRTG